MPTVTIKGGETIWYKTTGVGKPVLQIHGSAFGRWWRYPLIARSMSPNRLRLRR